jgi:hypothetical protein
MLAKSCVVAVMSLMLGLPLLAQRQDSDRLATAKGLKCEFSQVAIGSWKGETAQASVKPAALRLAFSAINPDEGTAQSVGEFGRLDVVATLSAEGLHILQSFRGGPLYVTTVFNRETRPGKFKAVHTRHEYNGATVPGFETSPEQYYGECELER